MADESNQITSEYFQNALEMKKKLDGISPSMCLAKWLQVRLHLTNGLTQSCHHPPTHKVSLEDLNSNPKALHNTRIKHTERQQMRNGVRPPGCEYCWKLEDAEGAHMSDRHFKSGETWARESFDEVVLNKFDYNVNPRYVEVNFNHTCNLKCSYCSPQISSSWAEEARKHGPFPTSVPHNDLTYFKNAGLMPIVEKGENPYLKAFWNWWPELYPQLKVFRMTGGEPLLDKNTFKIFDWIQQHPRPDLELALTSNMCVPPELMNKFINRVGPIVADRNVKEFRLFASVDTWGEQAEYIRNGLDFNYFWKNINRYLTEVPEGILNFIVTMNCLSIHNLQKLLEGVLELQKTYNKKTRRIFFDTPFLRDPAWMSMQILPDKKKLELSRIIAFMERNPEQPDTLVGFRDFQIARMKRVSSWAMQTPLDAELSLCRTDLYLFFNEHDRRRNTDFLKTFPDLSEFWQICKESAERQGSY